MNKIFTALVAKLKGELVTQLNVLATLVLLWVIQQPSAPVNAILAYVPASLHGLVTLAAPLVWGLVVQAAIELQRKRTVETTLNDLIVGDGSAG